MTLIMTVQFATMPGRDDRPNEDFAGAFPDCAVLLDGAGGPSEMPSGCIHGTNWYVRQLGARLLAGMENSARALPVLLRAVGVCPALYAILTLTGFRIDRKTMGDTPYAIPPRRERRASWRGVW